ncbi:methyltransferase domain-containing protein [Roseomonas sp. SG15]|uniref:Methyltransferase domain-containing protein n=1 Tax=Roseomonas indoligenes TaxID=2820811 RepID=A0A940MYW0_9PROT|nr:methyltransferase domain-containing protein [Pararoseomonas indoligenes]
MAHPFWNPLPLLRRLRSLAKGLSRTSPGQILGKLHSLEVTSGAAARNADLAAWNTKVMGSAMASQFYEAGLAGRLAPLPPDPVDTGYGGRLCRQEDIESQWLRHWCGQIGFVPLYHRKVWEDCYALQALYERGMMMPGRRGLGFAVGAEWLPSFLAARGVEVLATDIDADDLRARNWIQTDQHGGRVETIFKPGLIDMESFNERVSMRAVDMNEIPADLHGGFDFLWSICSLEHCGSIRQGLDFVVEAMKCLRPGGVAVHTTEFNMDPDGPTIEEGGTVLFQRRHIEELEARLALAGHRMLPMDFGTGTGILDQFVDLPPYPGNDAPLAIPEAPHLRLSIQGLVSTSIGFIVEKRA